MNRVGISLICCVGYHWKVVNSAAALNDKDFIVKHDNDFHMFHARKEITVLLCGNITK